MAVTAVLVLRDPSDEPKSGTTSSPLPKRGVLFELRRLGVVGVRPPGWRVKRSSRAVRLASPDRAGLVGVSVAPSSVGAGPLIASSLATVRRSYRRAKLTKINRARVGGIPGRTSGGTAVNSRGVPLDLVIATAEGRRRTYLLQVFVARGAGGRRLAEAQTIVNSLELSG